MKRLNIFTWIVVIFMLVICLKIYLESDLFNLRCVISTVDGNKYCVRERSRVNEAADLLAQTVHKCKKFVLFMAKTHPNNEITQRLVKGFNPQQIQETLPTSEHTAYSENKGEKVAFCLNKSKKNNTRLIDPNTLMFVALHELTHIGTASIGHTPEFWSNFKFVLENASDANLYNPVDYKKEPVGYCGMTISDNPYYDL